MIPRINPTFTSSLLVEKDVVTTMPLQRSSSQADLQAVCSAQAARQGWAHPWSPRVQQLPYPAQVGGGQGAEDTDQGLGHAVASAPWFLAGEPQHDAASIANSEEMLQSCSMRVAGPKLPCKRDVPEPIQCETSESGARGPVHLQWQDPSTPGTQLA